MKSKLLKVMLLSAVAALTALPASALDGVVIANDSVSVSSLSPDALKDIYTGKTKYWDGGQAVIIAVLPDKTDAALQQACGMDTSSFKTFWQRLAFSGRGQEPKHADDAASLVALVASTKGAIAIAPADATLNGVKKIDIK
jgi:ABC-type phosphate transport system substrate-binding protein